MKKRLFISAISAILFTIVLPAQSYRYLKVETIRCDNHKWQELEWIADGVAYPVTKMTAPTSNGMTASGDIGSTEIYKPYDGDVNTHAWLGYITPPQESKSITLDLGEGNEIDPDSLRITKPSYSQVMDFRVWASNDMVDWALMMDTVGLESSGFATMEFKLEEITDTEAPSVPVNLAVTSTTTSTIGLQWDPSSDNRKVLGYDVYIDDNLNGTTEYTNYLASGLSEASSYDFKVVAFDENGNYSDPSQVLTAETKLPDLTLPSDPTALVLDSASYHQLFFSWEASTDNDEISGYLIYLDGEVAGIADSSFFALPGLEANTEFSISVEAKDISGNRSAGVAEAQFQTTNDLPERMPVGTNFWNLGWGGYENDPFVDGHQEVTATDQLWKRAFLEETRFYSHFRFMDYLETNGSDLSNWLARKHKDEVNQNPMAFEWMIHLCNTQETDLWITVPHKVVSRNGIEGGSNHFMRKLAILIKTGVDMQGADLDDPVFENLSELTAKELIALGGIKTCEPLHPGLKFYLEYSNETWNGSFAQFQYCVQEGTALGLEGDTYAQGRRFHAWAALRLFEDAEEVFGHGNPRIIKIDAYQAVVPSQILDHYSVYKNADLNPRGIYPDAFAPAPYFGNGIDGAADDAVDELLNSDSGIKARTRSLKTARGYLDDALENGYPVNKLIAYEAGQHVITNAATISRSPEMYKLYVRYLDSCNNYLDEMSHYLHSGSFGSGGAWGSKEYIGQDMSEAHKYRALYEWNFGIATRPDTEKPTAPESLSSSDITDSGYTLHWTPGTDNHKVTEYIVNIDDQAVTGVTDTLLVVTSLLPGRTYSNTVQSVDSSGNVSAESNAFEVTTLGPPQYSVTFHVKDAEGESPVSGAQVIFDGSEMDTDTDGSAVFESIPSGTGYTYSISHTEYHDTSGTLDVVDDDVMFEILLDPLVGIASQKPHWKVYPNPVSDMLMVHTTPSSETEISIYDLYGRLIVQKECKQSDNSVDLGSLQTGMYTLKITSGNQSETRLLHKI